MVSSKIVIHQNSLTELTHNSRKMTDTLGRGQGQDPGVTADLPPPDLRERSCAPRDGLGFGVVTPRS